MFPYAVVGLIGLVVAAIGLTHGGVNAARVAGGLGHWPVEWIQAAERAARKYGVPIEWILATIIVESGGRPSVRGDADGRSVGLMQINAVAHAGEGVTATMLLNPMTNIDWGTRYIRQYRDEVLSALGGRTPPLPIDWLTRLAYKGPTTIENVLRNGQNPATAVLWAPEALRNWQAAMGRVSALTRSKLTA